jgi:hypothetical protein
MSYFQRQSLFDRQDGDEVWVDMFNNLRTITPVRLVGTTFIGATKDTAFWTEAVAGSGAVSQAAGQVVLATGVTANSTVQYQTVRLARWVPGSENHFRTILKLSNTGSVNNIRNWGMFDANNGVFFQLNGTTLNIVTRAATVDTAVAEASWNGSTAFVLTTDFHIWEILVSYAAIRFYIDGVLVHSKIITNTMSTLPVQSYNLPVTIQNNNSGGGTANVSVTVGVAFVARLGNLATDGKYANIVGAGTTVLKLSAGKLQRIVSQGTGTSATVYDNTSAAAPIIATINLGSVPVYLEYQAPFQTGLTIVTVGAGCNLTVVYE